MRIGEDPYGAWARWNRLLAEAEEMRRARALSPQGAPWRRALARLLLGLARALDPRVLGQEVVHGG